MKILVVGAGGVGGYFGGRLLAAGRDVTFLVRPKRAAALREKGLSITSPSGDLLLRDPALVLAEEIRTPYDLVLLSCKAYDLDDAMASFAPAVGPDTLVLPLLNGMKHLDALDARFGKATILGGQCVIAATLGADGGIRHLSAFHSMSFGVRPSGTSDRARAIADALGGAGFDFRQSDEIEQEMWEKWVFIAAGASLTSLLRASVGDIVAVGGIPLARRVIDECNAIAAECGHPSRPEATAKTVGMLTAAGSTMTASMLRDIEAGARIESDQIVGDLLARAANRDAFPLLGLVLTSLEAYEARRTREAASHR